jgi:hypothetical protein
VGDEVAEVLEPGVQVALLVLPCSPECSNWLRYGITPKDAGPGLDVGICPAKAHTRECLGVGGRRVQVSRHWTGKTLADHRADRATVVRQVLTAAGYEPPEADRMAASVLDTDGRPRYVWDEVPAAERDYARVILGMVAQARRWRTEYNTARRIAEQAGGPGGARAGPTAA